MDLMNKEKPVIVSMCLAGVACNYLGESWPIAKVVDMVDRGLAIPLCPEQLGGLTTPRTPAEQVGDKVIAKDGGDVTEAFEKGAQRTLAIAQQIGAEVAILKATSPSCGKGLVYDGTHSGTLVKGDGVTAGLLLANGIQVLTEDEI